MPCPIGGKCRFSDFWRLALPDGQRWGIFRQSLSARRAAGFAWPRHAVAASPRRGSPERLSFEIGSLSATRGWSIDPFNR
mmetsp:Transcript_76099/g.131925  ORF Transcript_76099/g.131925 Transcript_76099/m.131925 type:complete len:80 (-) Transcript_76099:143-382(-)